MHYPLSWRDCPFVWEQDGPGSPVGPSDVILQRVARGELSPEEGARSLEAGRERRPVDVVSFEDAGRATQQPNARGDK